jgi:predicted RNase H-like HicB family nuclease
MTWLADRFRIAKSWLTSFLNAEWRPEDYPTGVRKQVGVPRDATWYAQVLNWPGPVGLGATPDEARAALKANLLAIAENRRRAGKAVTTSVAANSIGSPVPGRGIALLDEPEPVRIADVLGRIRDRREA